MKRKKKREEADKQFKPFRDAMIANTKRVNAEKAARLAAEKEQQELEAERAEKASIEQLVATLKKHGYRIEKK